MGECHGQDAHRQVLSGQQDSGKPLLQAGASSIGPDAVGSQLERDVTTAKVKQPLEQQQWAIVTACDWSITLTKGALNMVALFLFNQLG